MFVTIKNVMSPRPSLAEDTKAVADGDLTADGYLKKPSWHRDVDIPSGKHTETFGKSWKITETYGKSWKITETCGKSWKITILKFGTVNQQFLWAMASSSQSVQ